MGILVCPEHARGVPPPASPERVEVSPLDFVLSDAPGWLMRLTRKGAAVEIQTSVSQRGVRALGIDASLLDPLAMRMMEAWALLEVEAGNEMRRYLVEELRLDYERELLRMVNRC